MKERQLAGCIGISFIISHFVIFILVVGLWALGGMDFEEMITSTSVILPLFTGYTTLVLGYIWTNRTQQSNAAEPSLTRLAVFSAFFFTFVFVLLIAGAILAKSFNFAFKSFEQFKIFLLVVETFFAGYASFIVKSLFRE